MTNPDRDRDLGDNAGKQSGRSRRDAAQAYPQADPTKTSGLDVGPPSERVDDETPAEDAKVTRRQE